MKNFDKITIVGVGMLGASIGMALKKKKLANSVVGFFRHRGKIAFAKKIGAIDQGTDDLREAVRGSDLILLCSPVSDIIDKLKGFKSIRPHHALITDIGSTKDAIVNAASGLNFIGAHPLAGSEHSGADFAKADLFEKSLCILTPTRGSSKNSLKKISDFWKGLGAKPMIMDPKTHDAILAFTSHLPHAAAFALIQAIPQNSLKFSAGGLKDTTRIALSKPEIWTDIFLSNRQEVLRSLAAFEKSLKKLTAAISKKDKRTLLSLLKKAQEARKTLP
jgi:prephenate dehydrogenase